MAAPEFEWDAAKERDNVNKHDVGFQEALTVFAPIRWRESSTNPDHSQEEPRELVIGHSAKQRLLVVSFTERQSRTRIISARDATAHERRDYEENNPDSA